MTAPHAARRGLVAVWAVLAVALAVLCSGCALFKPKPADTALAGPPEIAVYAFEVDAPGDLRRLLATYLDLSRFQRSTVTDAITPAELERLIKAAPAQARALLETEGYFNAEVEVERAPPRNELPLLRVHVRPGPRVLVGAWQLNTQGPLQQQIEAGDARAIAALQAVRGQWPLKPGRPFVQSDWAGAKNATLARLHAEGYAAASWLRTQADVDVRSQRAAIELLAESGPLYRLGELRVEGLRRYSEASVRRVANFGPGTPYSEQLLLDYQDRLRKLNLFETAAVEIDTDPATAQAAPVRVRVRELPLQQATVGAGYSDNTGQRVSLEHLHRHVFGRDFFGTGWIARNKFEIGRDAQSWEGELTSYPLEGGHHRLLAASVSRLDTAGTLTVASRVRAGREIDTERIERLVFGEVLTARTRDANGSASNQAVSANYNWTGRAVDSVLLPTDGQTASAELSAGYALSNNADNGPYSRLYGRITAYRPIGKAWYATARVEAGQVVAKRSVGIPEPLLFRAGGDDSVRGYAYRTLGPLKNGVLTSARVLGTGSLELARPILDSLPSVWGAVFVDAGNAAERWGSLDPALGYGVGVRWRSPVGPLRVDIAYGQEVRQFRLHFSVGIAL